MRRFVIILLVVPFLLSSLNSRHMTEKTFNETNCFFRLIQEDMPFSGVPSQEEDGAAATFSQKRLCFNDDINDLLVADFNKDGYPDIIVQGHRQIWVLLGNKPMTFTKRFKKKYPELEKLAGIADFNGDKKMDLAVTSYNMTRYFAVFPGKGNGSLKNPKFITSAENSFDFYYCSILDFNGDGKPDLMGMEFIYDTLVACQNLGKNKFAVTRNDNEDGDDAMTTGDFDGDGYDDVYVADKGDDKIYFFRSNGDGSFTSSGSTSAKNMGNDLYSADLSGDGIPDLIGAGDDSGQAWTMLGKGNGSMQKRKLLKGKSTLLYGAVLNHFNSDLKLDIAAAEKDGIYYYTGRKNGAFSKPIILGKSLKFHGHGAVSCSRNIGSGDFNQDGKIDIVATQYFGSTADQKSNLVFFINGGKAAKLKISNLQVYHMQYDGTYIYLQGSVNFSGSGLDLRYNPAGDDPTDSAFLGVKFKISFAGGSFTANYALTGNFIHNPNMDSGIIDFDMKLTSPTKIFGTPTTTSLEYIYLSDFNLVRSNELSRR